MIDNVLVILIFSILIITNFFNSISFSIDEYETKATIENENVRYQNPRGCDSWFYLSCAYEG